MFIAFFFSLFSFFLFFYIFIIIIVIIIIIIIAITNIIVYFYVFSTCTDLAKKIIRFPQGLGLVI